MATSILPAVATLNAKDRKIIQAVEPTLSQGRQLLSWWREVHARGGYQERTDLLRTFNRPYEGFAFYDETPVNGEQLPVMGLVDNLLYDQPKSADTDRFQQELREFVLKYLMRVSDFRQPEAIPDAPQNDHQSAILKSLSWCPDPEIKRRGFGYRQLYYKLRDGEPRKFAPHEETAIIDVRELLTKYEWIIVSVNIFDFKFSVPASSNSPQLVLPLAESSYLVLTADFVTDDENPHSHVDGQRCLGDYGFGYAFLKNPDPEFLAWGPGDFDAAIQTINFRVLDNGQARAFLVFVANRPKRIANVPIIPVDLGFQAADAMSFGIASLLAAPFRAAYNSIPHQMRTFDPVTTFVAAANVSTAGQASRELCISKRTLEDIFLVRHFMQHYQMLTGSLLTWRQIPDWLDEDALPEWVKLGIST